MIYIHTHVYTQVTKVITKNLNKVIDINRYPVEQAKSSNLRHRYVGHDPHVGHDSFVSYVGHDSFIHGTWLSYRWDWIHAFVQRDSFICRCATRFIHMYDVTHSYVRHSMWDLIPRVDPSDLRHQYVGHILTHMWDMTQSYSTWDMTYPYVGHDAFISGTCPLHKRDMTRRIVRIYSASERGRLHLCLNKANDIPKNRPIGIGVQGLADVFMKLRLPFERYTLCVCVCVCVTVTV